MSSKTSIILCTYNEAKYIENTISELEKNIPNLEIVIVDDWSSDGTIEIIKKLNQNNKYKAIYRKKSRGLASAFVRGVIETTGENAAAAWAIPVTRFVAPGPFCPASITPGLLDALA